MQMQQHYVSMIQRSETLPKDADPRSLKSEYKNGQLILTLQKMKSITSPVVKEKTKEKPVETSKPKRTKEKTEHNSTKIKVPHKSSHV